MFSYYYCYCHLYCAGSTTSKRTSAQVSKTIHANELRCCFKGLLLLLLKWKLHKSVVRYLRCAQKQRIHTSFSRSITLTHTLNVHADGRMCGSSLVRFCGFSKYSVGHLCAEVVLKKHIEKYECRYILVLQIKLVRNGYKRLNCAVL